MYALHTGGSNLAGLSSRVRGTLITSASLRVSRLSLVRGSGSNYLDAFLDEQFDEIRETDTRRFKRMSSEQESSKRHASANANAASSSNAVNSAAALRLVRFKLRVLVENGCTFVGFNLRRLFTVLRISSPANQLIDLGELFQLPVSNALTIRFLVWYYLRKCNLPTHRAVHTLFARKQTQIIIAFLAVQVCTSSDERTALINRVNSGDNGVAACLRLLYCRCRTAVLNSAACFSDLFF